MNLPNKLTVFRVFLVPVYVFFQLCTGISWSGWAALCIFILASVTDYFDGHIARKRNLVTDFGKFMDPLADKLLVCSALICFVQLGRLEAWIVIVIVAREFIISGFRLIAAQQGTVIAASMWGKSKTVSQMLLIILLIINPSGDIWAVVCRIAVYVALILTVISLADYIGKNFSVISKGGF